MNRVCKIVIYNLCTFLEPDEFFFNDNDSDSSEDFDSEKYDSIDHLPEFREYWEQANQTYAEYMSKKGFSSLSDDNTDSALSSCPVIDMPQRSEEHISTKSSIMIEEKRSEPIASKDQVTNAFGVAKEAMICAMRLYNSAKNQYGDYLREYQSKTALHSITVNGNYSFMR